jgi:protein phosphatase
VQLSVAARTDVGRIRAGNEDSLYADATESRGLFIVADGMGGHAAGEVASSMAVQIVARELASLPGVEAPEASERVGEALRAANRAIFERTIREAEKHGMGTTVSALLLTDGGYLIGQVGDSRIYLLRDGQLRQLTKDHSYVQEQIDAGYLTPEQARYHPYSNVITRCVGANAEVEPDVFRGELLPGDVFLVASDGLTGMVEDRRLAQLVASKASPGRVVDALIAEANGRGGLDNITAILVQVHGVDAAAGAARAGTANGQAPGDGGRG